jgi:ATP-dependent helicase/nuclease subunit A
VSHLLGESIHTESNDVSADLDLPFEVLGPDEIGSIIHGTLTGLVDKEVSEAALESREDIVIDVFDSVVSEVAPTIDTEQRERLWNFFVDVLAEFLDSELWKHIQAADSVHVEKSIDGLVTTNDLEVEVSGQADIVIDLQSGERVVTDIKIALADPTDTTQDRYDLQVSSYEYSLDRQKVSSQSVRATIETFGVHRETVTASWHPEIIEFRIRNLD